MTRTVLLLAACVAVSGCGEWPTSPTARLDWHRSTLTPPRVLVPTVPMPVAPDPVPSPFCLQLRAAGTVACTMD